MGPRPAAGKCIYNCAKPCTEENFTIHLDIFFSSPSDMNWMSMYIIWMSIVKNDLQCATTGRHIYLQLENSFQNLQVLQKKMVQLSF